LVRGKFLTDFITMSQHRSLKGASTITVKRNVLKRFERVEVLKKRGQWKPGQRVIGLPKTQPDA
jgi:small basic protein (TIGR04137 family)